MTSHRLRIALLAAMLTAAPAAGAVDAEVGERSLELLRVEANEGSSSGGHVALRLDDEVYHFQHHAPGILRLQRDTWARFRFHYGDLENRGITRYRIDGEPASIAAMRDDFASLLVIQRKQLTALGDATDDAALLDRVAATGGDISASILAAGFFATTPRVGPESDDTACGTLSLLRRRAEVRHGAGFLAAARRETLRRARSTRPVPARPATTAPLVATRRDYPRNRGLQKRLTDAWSELVALTVLERAACLAADATTVVGSPLTTDERDALRDRAAAVEARMLDLLVSTRSDKGYPLLVGMARLLALQASLQRGRLVMLDAFPDPPAEGRDWVELRRANLRDALRERSARELEDARRDFFAGDYDEADLSRLEAAATRYAALDRAASDGRLRIHPGALTPSRSATWSGLPTPAWSDAELERSRRRARETTAALREQIRAAWDYDLVTRNCATEIFRQLRSAAPELAAERRRGWMEFVPGLAGAAVERSFEVAAVERLPSLHERYAADVAKQSPLAALAETNTWTSHLYADWSSDTDSTFLFFARDPAPLRPLFGIANLAAGLGAAAASLPLAPMDGGERLGAAARGIVFSVPELFWINIRKGSFAYVEEWGARIEE